jgi:16S rRNA (guanine966-N2)-methyltransferase
MIRTEYNTFLVMRITGGASRGMTLKVPLKCEIRPTTDRVRGAIFSILASSGSSMSRCLDLYAGTGALGIEALSRDAEWVDFVDQEPRCCAIIKQNLEKAGFDQKAHIYCRNVSKTLSFLDKTYDVIFMDPPYSDANRETILTQLDNPKLVGNSSLVIIPHATRFPVAEAYGRLHLIKQRRHGDTCISIFAMESEN